DPPPAALVARLSPLPGAGRDRDRARHRRCTVERTQGAPRLRLASRPSVVRRRDPALRGRAVRAGRVLLADAAPARPRRAPRRGAPALDALLPASLRAFGRPSARDPDPRATALRRLQAGRLARERLREPGDTLR